MRAPHRLLQDVTEATIRAVDEDIDIKALNVKGNRGVVATGIIRRVPLGEDIIINLGYLRGQSAYSVQAKGTDGLAVEVRLEGTSSARRVGDTGPKHEVRPGDYFILAQKEPRDWDIEAPAQEVFKSVSINYTKAFVDGLGDAGLRAASDMLFERGQHLHGSAPTILTGLAQAFFSLDPDKPFELLRARHLAMGILLEAMSHQIKAPYDTAQGDHQIAQRAEDFVHQNLSVALTIEDVAQHCRVSASALKAAFRSATGGAIGAFIKDKRMAQADHLLRQGVPISDVAQTFQYSAPESFARAYGRHFGHPPSQARRQVNP